jgi:serine/threonine protein kinase/WD40 repeat protein
MSSNDPTGSFHAANSDTRLGEVVAAYLRGQETGQPVSREALLAEHPDLAAELEAFFANHDRLEQLTGIVSRRTRGTGSAGGSPGTTIRYFGDYELLEEIASGGMGVVYKARQISLNRPVAVKMILAGHLASESDVRRFQAEAEAAANLRHPGVVAIYEVGVHEGQHFYSMEYVEGRNLSQIIRDPAAPGLPAAKAAEYVRDMAEIVQYAHTQGVLHRDLKPSNVMIDTADRVRITDFGLAKRVGTGSDLTISGQIIGTPSYMSPEQAAAHHTLIGPSSDVYALGAILYELVTGRAPFRSDSAVETLRQVQQDDPVTPRLLSPQLPKDLETICLKCLEKEPRRRYDSAQEMADDLGRFLRGEPIRARSVSRLQRAWRWCKREPVVAGLSAAVVISFIAGTVVSTLLVQSIWSRAALLRARYGALAEQARTVGIARQEGYRQKVFDLVTRALALPTPEVDIDELRQVAVRSLGDFVGLEPTVLTDFPEAQPPNAIALAQNGMELAAGFKNGAVAVYDVGSGLWERLRASRPGEIQSLRYTANETQIVAVETQGVIHRWTRGAEGTWDHAELRGLTKVLQPTSKLELTPDGTMVLVRQSSRRIDLWDIAREEVVARFPAPSTPGDYVAAVSPNRKWLAFAYEEGLHLLEFATGRESVQVPIKRTYKNQLIFSPNSEWIALASDRGLTTYDVPALRERELDRSGPIKEVAFSPDSRNLATFGIRGDVVLRRLETNQLLASLTHPRNYASYASSGVQFSGNGGQLASFERASIRLWKLRSTPERITLDGHVDAVPCVVFNPQGTILASASKDRTVKLWDPANGALTATLIGFRGMVQNSAFSPDGKLFATAQWAGEDSIQFWDTQNWKPVPVQWVSQPGEKAPRFTNVCRIAFSPAGEHEYFASAATRGVVLWRMHRETGDGGRVGALRFEYVRHWTGERCHDCAISPDGKWLTWVQRERPANKSNASGEGATLQDVYQLRLWNITKEQKIDLTGPRLLQEWHSLAFFPDSQRLAFISESKRPEVWRLPDGVQESSLETAEPFIASHMALNKKNGRWFAGKIAPTEVVIWDMSRHKRMFALRSEATEVVSLDWSPDGQRLALGLHDGRVVVWDLQRVNAELSRIGLEWRDNNL